MSKLFNTSSNDSKLWEFIYFRKFKNAIFDQDYKDNNNIQILNNNNNSTSTSTSTCSCYNLERSRRRVIVCKNKKSNHNWKVLYKQMHLLSKKITKKKSICHIIGCQRIIIKNKMNDHLKLHLKLQK